MVIESPTVASWVLANRIRNRRVELDLGVPTVVQRLDVSRPYWSRVENDRAALSEPMFGEVMDLLRFEDDERIELRRLWELARTPEWFAEYDDLLEDGVRRFYGLERGANYIRYYEGSIVSGLLQTDDYAHALIVGFTGNRPTDYGRLTELRAQRKQLLELARRPQIRILMNEAVLWQQVGSADILVDQLFHLLDVIDAHAHDLWLRIHPFSKPLGSMGGGPTFSLLGFEHDDLPTVAYLESLYAISTTSNPSQVNMLAVSYDQDFANALDETESRELIAQRLTELTG